MKTLKNFMAKLLAVITLLLWTLVTLPVILAVIPVVLMWIAITAVLFVILKFALI